MIISEMMDHEYDIAFILEKDAKKKEAAGREDLKTPFNPVYNINYENANLNPKYKFDTFVVGSNNKFAHSSFPSRWRNLREKPTIRSISTAEPGWGKRI